MGQKKKVPFQDDTLAMGLHNVLGSIFLEKEISSRDLGVKACQFLKDSGIKTYRDLQKLTEQALEESSARLGPDSRKRILTFMRDNNFPLRSKARKRKKGKSIGPY